MNYQNYEEYMRNVLGYSPYPERNYTYTDAQEDMYTYTDEMPIAERPAQDLTAFYPEIYRIIYPMVCKTCNMNSNREITKDLLEQMTDEIYRNVEPEDQQIGQRAEVQLKNGDVINPNAKEPEQQTRETRQNNFLLRDLIRILLLRELLPVTKDISLLVGILSIPKIFFTLFISSSTSSSVQRLPYEYPITFTSLAISINH